MLWWPNTTQEIAEWLLICGMTYRSQEFRREAEEAPSAVSEVEAPLLIRTSLKWIRVRLCGLKVSEPVLIGILVMKTGLRYDLLSLHQIRVQ
jgi:hypothetical protein